MMSGRRRLIFWGAAGACVDITTLVYPDLGGASSRARRLIRPTLLSLLHFAPTPLIFRHAFHWNDHRKLQRHPKRVVFPEGIEPRVLQAARANSQALRLGAPILLGDRAKVKEMAPI